MQTATPSTTAVMPPLEHIPAVPVDDLHLRLGFSEPLQAAESSKRKPLHRWKMETDDAPIFRYLYRSFAPRRHLEFGTWQGDGALYCLEESAATVWTINLLGGESRDDGTWAYGELMENNGVNVAWSERQDSPDENKSWYRTDALGFIGHKIHRGGYGHRVCQIYSDSREWDDSQYPDGLFDTVLIDGSHEPDVVAADTEKSLRLLRTGGLMLWHDFCPDPIARKACESVAGVTTAISRLQSTLDTAFSDVFWIQPSWILVGMRNR